MQLRVLSRADLESLLDMPAAIAAMERAFAALSRGTALVPVRTVLAGESTTLVMPGLLADSGVAGAKVVSVAPRNRERGLPAIHALVALVDGRTGMPVAVMEGGWLTRLRTGAATGLATDRLARPDARVLTVVGAGAQAPAQIEAVRAVRPIESVRVVSASGRSAMWLAQTLEGVDARGGTEVRPALEGADVVVTVTDSPTPVIREEWVAPGTHLNAVGAYRPDMRELTGHLMGRARVVVDQRAAALEEAGDVVQAIAEGHLREEDLSELGDVVLGRAAGRRSDDEITVFKSVGSAAQDLAVAALALERAVRDGVGALVDL